ncbi:MAG TPA: citrate synthase [Lachnospiraceae bacterium]|nr:citrate synthase [Lachnospiraceae bacterium]
MNYSSSFNDDSILARYFGKSSNYTDIPNNLFHEYNVKKGLRNDDGTGVRIGLTRVSDVIGYREEADGTIAPAEGELLYRGYSIKDLVRNRKGNFGYEETCFLLLFGFLPDKYSFMDFKKALSARYDLPNEFLVNELLRDPTKNLMNGLMASTLSLYNYDENPDTTDVYQTLLKGLNLLAKFPSIACYTYQAKIHNFYRHSLVIHYPRPDYSIAENILYMLRADGKFTKREANLLDAILVIHADHGGGNNSTFTTVVMGSTGTDLYSAICGSIGSLKGPKHGGANISVNKMMKQIIADTDYTTNKEEVRSVIRRILNRDYYDRSGLIYGFGHAVYTISDPRAELLRDLCQQLADEQGCNYKFRFYELFEETVKEEVFARRGKVIPANVDYYSGFAYDMLGIPEDLFTPLFAIARVAGWVAHNLENKLYDGKIMRPATKYVGEHYKFVPMDER